MAESENAKFKLGDLVWAKVKGFQYWPSQITENEKIKFNRKIKNPYCVYFFGSNNFAVVSEDQIKPYQEFREQYSNVPKKSQQFRAALETIEDLARKGGSGSTKTVSSSTNNTSSAASVTTGVGKQNDLFKPKKAVAATPLTRDYSRTPFKREKRNFETANETETKKPNQVKNPEPSEKKAKLSPAPVTQTRLSSSSDMFSKSSADQSESSVSSHSSNTKQSKIDTKEEKMSEIKTMNKSGRSKPSSLKFGFIGLGKMGQQLVKLLLNSRHEVTIWNRTPSKTEGFEKQGANIAKTPGDVVRESDITFSCLSDAAAATTIFFGNCGVVNEINATKGYVELTSMNYSTSIEIETAVKSKGGRYIEAPIILCSLPKQIEDGKLVAMVSGNRSLFDDCSSCFEAICSQVYFLSESAGNASKMNLIISSYYGNMVAGLSECMSMVERFGLINRDFVEIIMRSPMGSPWIQSKLSSIIDSTVLRDIPQDHVRRDLNYMLQISNEKTLSTPITATVNEVLKQKKHHYY